MHHQTNGQNSGGYSNNKNYGSGVPPNYSNPNYTMQHYMLYGVGPNQAANPHLQNPITPNSSSPTQAMHLSNTTSNTLNAYANNYTQQAQSQLYGTLAQQQANSQISRYLQNSGKPSALNSVFSALPLGHLNQQDSRPHLQSSISTLASSQYPMTPFAKEMMERHNRSKQNAPMHAHAKANRLDKSNELSEPHLWTELDVGGVGIKNISLDTFNLTHLTALYLCHNVITYLPPEISKLTNLVKLDVSNNRLTVIPPELGRLVCLKELLLFDNSIAHIPLALGTLYKLEFLGLEGNPIGEPLASMLLKNGTAGVIAYLRDNSEFGEPPPSRNWIQVDSVGASGIDGDSERVRMMTFNILSDQYATPAQYGYTPNWALDWNSRKDLILQEISSRDCDIICLQELEQCQYEELFRPELDRAGYDSFFCVKTRARTMSEQERSKVDGCATFWRRSQFKKLETKTVEFSSYAMSSSHFGKTDTLFTRFFNKDNVGGIAILESVSKGTKMAIANTHLHWDPACSDVKLIQIAIFTSEIEKTIQAYLPDKKTPINRFPVILCGDFNSFPNSGVCEYLTKGMTVADHQDLNGHQYGAFAANGLSHKLSLKSAYSENTELSFTNFTPTFKAVIDYIWYTPSCFTVTGYLGGISPDYSKKFVGFPNQHMPSDHISLVSEFILKSPTKLPYNTPVYPAKSSGKHLLYKQ